MKPLNLKNFWLSAEDFMGIDIFQTRESLYGYSFASVLSKNPKEFKNILKAKVG